MQNKSMSPAVSVVLPVFNTEEFLEECVSSLIHQTLQNIELIFVDDGSTDNSVGIIESYQAKDHRIKIIKQKKQFAGVARNNGMSHATGKYIIFLDSDDFFELNMLEDMYQAAERSKAEIVYCGYKTYDNSTKEIISIALPDKEGLYKTSELGGGVFFLFEVPWNKLILRQFIIDQNLKYQAIRNTNDLCFNQVITVLSTYIYFINKCFVNYRINNKKSLQGQSPNYKLCYGDAYMRTKEELLERGRFTGEIKNSFYQKFFSYIEYRISLAKNQEEARAIFLHFKEYLPKIIVGDESAYSTDERNLSILNNENLNEYILHEYKRYYWFVQNAQKSYAVKESKEYRIGQAILFVPRKLKTILRKIARRV